MAGTGDRVKGKLKEATGILIGDKKLEREGKVDNAVGEVKGAVAKVVDKVRDVVAPANTLGKRSKK